MQSLNTLNRVALNLSRINDFDELVYQSIQQAIEHLGFTRLSCWLLDDVDTDVIVGRYRVDNKGGIIDSSHERMELKLDHPAYNVVKGNKTSYVIRSQPLYNVKLEEIGFGDKAFVPLLDGDQAIGCLYSDTLLEDGVFSDDRVDLLNLYGSMLGALLNRQRSLQVLEERETQSKIFQHLLKQLSEMTLALSVIQSLDDLIRETVVLGREMLGFERIGVWLASDKHAGMRRGMWGTDLDGNLRDERGYMLPIPEQEAAMVSEGDVVYQRNEPITEPDGATKHKNSVLLIGVLWDGSKRIGWLYADTAISKTPFTHEQFEIFRLLSAQLGAMCAQRIVRNNLRQSEIRYRAITEASSDIILIIDESAVIKYISPSVRYVMDIEPELVVGNTIHDMIHNDDIPQAESVFKQCVDNPILRTRMHDVRVWHIHGHWVHMEVVVTSMFDNPAIDGILLSCRDITQRLIAEERKRLAEREQERAWLLRQFISDISHDFRTPLSTIGTNAYLLTKSNGDNLAGRAEMIQKQIDRITTLIDNMNMIAKLDETSDIVMSPTELNDQLRSAMSVCQPRIDEKQLSVKLSLQASLPMIRGNATLLHDAFVHLLANATLYSDEGKTITITSVTDEAEIVLTIADEGIGISAEDLPHIFDRLYRVDKARNTNSGGGGLGLAITRRIIELHGGTIQVESEVDVGTTITMRFPKKDDSLS